MKDQIKSNIRIISAAATVILILGYTLYEARFLIEGPRLTIFSPGDFAVVSDSLLEIKGQAGNISGLTVDGRPVMTTTDGLFDDKLLLMDGYNTIEVKVFNKFGQKNQKIIKIWLEKQTPP